MPKYHRVLVRYRLPTSEQWSDLHWCDIERTESNEMRVRVASAVQGAHMPGDDKFEDLAPESAKKLLVIDCSGPEETSGGWPLRARTSSDFESYCLVFTANAMFRIVFQSQTKLFMQQGQCWVQGNRFNLDNLIRLQHCFTPEEIAADKRLQMRTKSTADNYAINHVIHLEEGADTFQRSGVGQSHNQTNQDWLTTERRQNVAIDMASVSSALKSEDRILLHDTVCTALSSVKSLSNSPDEYQMALHALLGKAKNLADCSYELKAEVQSFRDRMLCDSVDLNKIFAPEVSSHRHPSLASVCQYVSECVFLELKNQYPNDRNLTSEMFVRPSPPSYLEIHLGRPNQQSVRLVGSDLLHPRQHGRYGLFGFFCGYIPSAAPQVNRLLLRWMGAGLCALGVYLAFSSFFTGAAIIAGGLLCLLASTLNSNRNPAPVEPSRHSARL
ncbi:MAG: hypothetical protein EBY22_05945 [Gammaproteobacteria bacterium]|nr:hypothetical protein [Gammaproteobacteria bacterium]